MEAKIISLSCPNCGNAEQHVTTDIHFGYQFKCGSCGSSSVLIVNNRLYMPMPGERVCTSCGQVAERNARYCQCGRSLVRKCIYPTCLKDFPINHEICDHCGWDQNIEPFSNEGKKQRVIQSIRDMSDPDPRVSAAAYKYAQDTLLKQQDAQILLDAIHTIDPTLTVTLPLLIDAVLLSNNMEVCSRAWKILSSLSEAQIYNPAYQKGLLQILADAKVEVIKNESAEIIPYAGTSLIPHLIEIMDSKIDYALRERCQKILINMGPPAVPLMTNYLSSHFVSEAVQGWVNTAIKEGSRVR